VCIDHDVQYSNCIFSINFSNGRIDTVASNHTRDIRENILMESRHGEEYKREKAVGTPQK
jgi:hypothetical protein